MPWFHIPGRRQLQPIGGAEVDLGHWGAKDLIYLKNDFNLISGMDYGLTRTECFTQIYIGALTTGSPHVAQSPLFGQLRGRLSAQFIFNATKFNARWSASGEATAIAVNHSIADSPGGNDGPFSVDGVGVTPHYPYIDGLVYCGPFSTTRWVNGIAPVANVRLPHVTAATYKSGAQAFYINGRKLKTDTIAGTPAINALGGNLCGPNGGVYFWALYDRVLPDSEIEELSENPWQLLRPVQRRIYVPSAGGGAVTVSVDAAAETDAAQALGKLKARALSAAAETDSAQAVAARKTLAVSVATEADAAHAVGKAKTLAVGHAAETDTAQTIAPLGAIVEAVTAATEIDSAQNVGRIKTLALGASAEADAAQAIAVVIAGEQIVSVAAAAETDTAQVIGARKTLSLASINETDAAQIILPRKELAVQPATEADSAQAIAWAPKILQLGVATETDQAQAITLAAAGLTLEQKCDLLLKLLRNKQITDPATGLMTIYDDDDTTPLLTANIYEDAAGTVLYRGRGAERRERLQ